MSTVQFCSFCEKVGKFHVNIFDTYSPACYFSAAEHSWLLEKHQRTEFISVTAHAVVMTLCKTRRVEFRTS